MKKTALSKFGLVLIVLVLAAFATLGCGEANSSLDTELPNIGITWCDEIDTDEYGEDLQAYIDAVEKAGGNPILLPLIDSEEEAKEILKSIGALILTGGEDVNPIYYDEEPDPYLEEVNEKRDKSDFLLLDAAIESDFPILAICRGCQVLNVIRGGTLYQDIPTQYESTIPHRSSDEIDFEYHDINIAEDSHLAGIMGSGILNVNSWHHQGIKELGDGLAVTAKTEDEMIEAIEMVDASFIIGVQFHPEWHVDDGDMEFLKMFKKIIKLAL